MIIKSQGGGLTHHKNVIPSPVSGTWRFFDFVSPNGTNPIEEWYQDELSEEAQITFNKILKDCKKTENHLDWGAFKRFLKGKKKHHIWELRFFCDRRQYRVWGIFNAGKQATLLVGCYHKEKVYTPADALDLAYKRAELLANGKAGRHERKIKTYQ